MRLQEAIGASATSGKIWNKMKISCDHEPIYRFKLASIPVNQKILGFPFFEPIGSVGGILLKFGAAKNDISYFELAIVGSNQSVYIYINLGDSIAGASTAQNIEPNKFWLENERTSAAAAEPNAL